MLLLYGKVLEVGQIAGVTSVRKVAVSTLHWDSSYWLQEGPTAGQTETINDVVSSSVTMYLRKAKKHCSSV